MRPKIPAYAKYKCNKCGKVVFRNLGWKVWTTSFCEETGLDARLYRISTPVYGDKNNLFDED